MADGVTPEIERLRKRLFGEYQREAGDARVFLIQAADMLAAADRLATGVRRAVQVGYLGPRTMAADACVDYEDQRERLSNGR